MSVLSAAHTPKMLAWAKQQINTKEPRQLVDALVRCADTKGAKVQAVAVMALCIAADQELGDAWLGIGQLAHSISMQAAERFAQYGDNMRALSEKQLMVVANAVLQAKEQPNDSWI